MVYNQTYADMLPVIIFGILGIILLIIPAVTIIKWIKKNKASSKEDFEKNPIEIVTVNARAIKKQALMVQTGTSRCPSHEICYKVLFLLEDESERPLTVPQEYYENIIENQNGTLVFSLSGDEFVDFQV